VVVEEEKMREKEKEEEEEEEEEEDMTIVLRMSTLTGARVMRSETTLESLSFAKIQINYLINCYGCKQTGTLRSDTLAAASMCRRPESSYEQPGGRASTC
jgi:hypothetical protein